MEEQTESVPQSTVLAVGSETKAPKRKQLPRSPIGRDAKSKKIEKVETVLCRVLGVGVIQAKGMATKLDDDTKKKIITAYQGSDVETIHQLLAKSKTKES